MEESIIGYKDPSISLDFRANDLKPSIDISFKQKVDLASILPDKKQLDPEAVFREYLPSCTPVFSVS
jgi:histone acetyltransferase 1